MFERQIISAYVSIIKHDTLIDKKEFNICGETRNLTYTKSFKVQTKINELSGNNNFLSFYTLNHEILAALAPVKGRPIRPH